MFRELKEINARPKPFEFYTASDLWTDEYISEQMLSFHLNEDVDLSSRNAKFIKRSVEWIASNFNIEAGTKIADFGCGPGLYSTKLAQRKANVIGIDFSKRSIQYARDVANKEGLAIQYVNQNYLDFETDNQFDLILMIMCDFCALSPSQRNIMLNKFYEILAHGGSVLLDAYSLTAFQERKETSTYEANLLNGFWSPDDYYGFQNTFKYDKEKVVLDKYTIIEADRTRTIYNWLQYFSHNALKKEFEDCGFAVENLYSDVAGSPFDPDSREFAIAAMKP
ncbi:MAG: class I SAM-dependent methyltransferase [Planctomycetota bacterium]|nr:MAG: class I SAM-dependent methyltransferase [Planctomycetota bacterium]